MTVTFVFWNLGGKKETQEEMKPLLNAIVRLASEEYKVDVFMFAEFPFDPYKLLSVLKQNDLEFHYAKSPGDIEEPKEHKIKIFTRFDNKFLIPLLDDPSGRLTIRHLKLINRKEILLAVFHHISKLYSNDIGQTLEITVLSDAIRAEEDQLNLYNTILVGDFNMHPFEDGVVSAKGLHGVMTREIAKGKYRTVHGRPYTYFYNPMWSFLGDASPGPPGTYYCRVSDHKAYFWHMFDQVLVRPELLSIFDSKDLRILEYIGKNKETRLSLLNVRGVPNKKLFSDHLPILFRLNI